MTRQSSQASTGNKSKGKQAGGTIPQQPRDCGPNVDTWPILDAPGDEPSRAKGDEQRQGKGSANS